MFNFFKRAAVFEIKQRPRQAEMRPGAPPDLHEPAPVPLQVIEGNEESDWAMWEDSVAALDSQMQPLAASATVSLKGDDTPSQFHDIDPFSSTGKNHG